MTDNVYNFISLAMKAGKVVSGEQGCEKAVKNRKVHWLLLLRTLRQIPKRSLGMPARITGFLFVYSVKRRSWEGTLERACVR